MDIKKLCPLTIEKGKNGCAVVNFGGREIVSIHGVSESRWDRSVNEPGSAGGRI
jgi:hypothetical protein